MAQVGRLVRLGNGRWARFEKVPVCVEGQKTEESLIVAVELSESEQERLDAEEQSLLQSPALLRAPLSSDVAALA
jgi:hypothetical protein